MVDGRGPRTRCTCALTTPHGRAHSTIPRWGKGTRGGIMRQGLKEGDDDAHTMRTIRDTSRAAHGKVLSSDVFVPMTQPVVSDQPGSAMFVVHLPPVDPTKKPPCILSPPIVVAIPCCCCVGTFNVCARVMPALANLWSVFCVNQQRQCFSLDAMRSCCATDILLANSTFCCVCKSESDTLDTRRVIVTATHDTGVLQGGQVRPARHATARLFVFCYYVGESAGSRSPPPTHTV